MSPVTRKPMTKCLSHIAWLDASKQTMNSMAMIEEAMRVC